MSQIPRTFIQTSLAPPLDYVVQMLQGKAKGWQYQHFDDAAIMAYFADNPSEEFPNMRDKFYSFSSGPHRADLFRYYYLYLQGGVYIDSDAMLLKDLDEIMEGQEFASVKSYHRNRDLIFNGFLGVTPKHPIMHAALKDIYQLEDSEIQADYFVVCSNLH